GIDALYDHIGRAVTWTEARDLPLRSDPSEKASAGDLIVADAVSLEGSYAAVAVRQHHVGLGPARHEMAKTRRLPLQPDLAQQCCGGYVIVRGVVNLESAGHGISQHHVGAIGAEKTTSTAILPTGCDLTQGVASENRITADIIDQVSAVSAMQD